MIGSTYKQCNNIILISCFFYYLKHTLYTLYDQNQYYVTWYMVYIQTVMNSMEIEKEIASNNNNMSSFKNKWSPLKRCPSDK